ncbi:oligopeptide:H+ symporter [Corynebacterium freneyi]|nr:oligopeptide:H+ symporter [Corynebacterium freneyi]
MPAIVGVELWERFSFYGMQAIMAYYLYDTVTDGGLGLSTTTATALMGAYGSLVYLCTIAGGWIADRVLGAERTLLAGAWTLVAGHLSLALLPGGAGVAGGLVLVAAGSGALKTSAITMLGRVRADDDRRRDSYFQLFYLGINVGALLGPLLTGWLSTRHGYHIGFGAAAVLMTIGLVHYLLGRRRLSGSWLDDARVAVEKPSLPIARSHLAGIIGAVLAAIAALAALTVSGALPLEHLATVMLVATLAATIVLFGQMLADRGLGARERSRVLAFLPLFIASVAFWAILNQTFGALAVYSDVRVDRIIGGGAGGWEAPAAWAQSLNPIFILTLSAPLAVLRLRLGDRMPGPAAQITGGTALAGVGVMCLLPFTGHAAGTVPLLAVIAAYGIITLGELHVGPVGMSAATSLAPAKYRTRFSALFFMTMAIGTALAGVLSTGYDPANASAERTYFLTLGLSAIAVAVVAAIAAALVALCARKTTRSSCR